MNKKNKKMYVSKHGTSQPQTQSSHQQSPSVITPANNLYKDPNHSSYYLIVSEKISSDAVAAIKKRVENSVHPK